MKYKDVVEKYGEKVGLEVLNFIEEEWGENGGDVFKFDDFDSEVIIDFIENFSSISK